MWKVDFFRVVAIRQKYISKFGSKVDICVLHPLKDDGSVDLSMAWLSCWHLKGQAPWWLASEMEEFKKSFYYAHPEKLEE